MGRIGTGAYETISQTHPNLVAGIDIKPDVVDKHIKRGRRVLLADATDPDFWQRVNRLSCWHGYACDAKTHAEYFCPRAAKSIGIPRPSNGYCKLPRPAKELEDMGVDSNL